MPTFVYTAKDQKGSLVEGTMEADGRNAVVARLQQMGYFPVRINVGVKKGGKIVAEQAAAPPASPPVAVSRASTSKTAIPKLNGVAAPSTAPAEPRAGFRFSFMESKVSTSDVANFNRQLADLIGAGIPLVKALGILQRQTTNEKLKQVIVDVLDDVQEGATFAEALKKHPRVFSKLYVAMVRSGEAGGMLQEVLNRLADFSENEENLRGKVKAALAYPVVMIAAGSVAVFVMFSYVIPKITATFEQLGQTLPTMTQILIMISHWFSDYWWAILMGIVLVVIGFFQFTTSREGRLMWHRLQLRLPLMGPLVQKRECARFTRTLGSLLKNGVSILMALDIVREVVDNSIVKAEVDKVVEAITQGSSIAQPLAGSQVFPSVAVNMIAIGEETGRLPEVLLRVSESFEIQVERQVRTMTSLIEPLIICVMGVVVAFIVISMLLPIFSLDPTGKV
ncbi:type II secretion system F family protein [Candidatus Sumerlaeota bacterium]|nr:type II secretion system F family protein [Candidatus Sumerlaeota bacterium]